MSMLIYIIGILLLIMLVTIIWLYIKNMELLEAIKFFELWQDKYIVQSLKKENWHYIEGMKAMSESYKVAFEDELKKYY